MCPLPPRCARMQLAAAAAAVGVVVVPVVVPIVVPVVVDDVQLPSPLQLQPAGAAAGMGQHQPQI